MQDRNTAVKRWRIAAIGTIVVACLAAWVAFATPASHATTTAAAAQACGQDIVYKNQDPQGVLKTMPADIAKRYDSWPFKLAKSPWTSFKGVKGPWKIGLIMFAHAGPWDVDVEAQARKEFAAAKAKGLVTGNLLTYISPSAATQTPEQQISAIQSMVHQGVNGIMILPLNGNALGPATTAAGKAGVPVVTIDNFIPTSKYAVNVWSDSSTLAHAGVAGMVKKGNVLIVRGIAGNLTEKAFYDAAVADIKACPGMKVAGTLFGDFSSAKAKSVVTSYLISHPGQKIDAVFQIGVMGAGVIDAFQSLGKTVPPISLGGCQGGDLSWWLAHKDQYKTVAQCFNGFQQSYSELRILMRILGGKGVRLNSITLPAPVVTNQNLAQYATAGQSLNWTGEPRGPLDALCSEKCLDGFFLKPGTPTHP